IKMTLNFASNKKCNAFENLVKFPENRAAIREFNKHFNSGLIKPSIKIFQKFKSSENAYIYNMAAGTNNKIELKSGVRDNDPSVLKVRLQDSYRKFFYFFCDDNCNEFSLKKDWVGQFNQIKHIHIYEINNHDYSKA
ncbi:hypothetical protein, partial [Elizabethkingia miricola]